MKIKNKKCVVTSTIIVGSLYALCGFSSTSAMVRGGSIIRTSVNNQQMGLLLRVLTLSETNSTNADRLRKTNAATGLVNRGPTPMTKTTDKSSLTSLNKDKVEAETLSKIDSRSLKEKGIVNPYICKANTGLNSKSKKSILEMVMEKYKA